MNLACVAEGVCPKCGAMLIVCKSCDSALEREMQEGKFGQGRFGVCPSCPGQYEGLEPAYGTGRDHYRCHNNEVTFIRWVDYHEVTVPLSAAVLVEPVWEVA